ncbi:MAG TPA: hypothetical protein VFX48_06395 [Saprospiraceae bacterium]|nr:hypothetical protein [Saprospiraceae bacterium]
MIRSGLFLFVLLFYLAHPLGAQKFWLTTYEFPGGPKTGISGVGDTCLIAGLTNGVLRSFDEGRNWDTVLTSLSIFSVHATPQGIVLAGGRGEIYYSNDMGTTWDSIRFPHLFPFVEFAHNDRGELFAISGELDLFNGFVGDGVYFSSDNGHSWTPRNQGLDPYLSCMQIAIDRNGRLYVAVNDESISGKGGLFISEDKGMSWQHVDILVDGKGVIENFVEVEHATGLSISPDDSIHNQRFWRNGQRADPAQPQQEHP